MVQLLGAPAPPVPEEPRRRQTWADVPWRTIVASVAVVAVAIGAVALIAITLRILVWIVIAGFFAIVLAPAVARVQARTRGRRAVATSIVMFSSAIAIIGMFTVFALPVRSQAISAATDLPGTIDAAAEGKGPVGQTVQKLHLQSFVQDHRSDIQSWADDLQGSSFSIARRVINVVIGIVTVFVLTFLFLTQSTALSKAAIALVPERRRPAARRAAADAARAISGYMLGNLLISLIAGVAAFICLLILGVPNPIVLALWVAFADLIPLVGATIGAALAVFAAFLHSPTAGIVAIVFFVVYQQVENNALQPMVMSRTVQVNPIVVILSVLLGVEVFGITGALLAIPIVGALQVAVRAGWHEYHQDHLRIDAGGPLT